jgi:hypothetical protein
LTVLRVAIKLRVLLGNVMGIYSHGAGSTVAGLCGVLCQRDCSTVKGDSPIFSDTEIGTVPGGWLLAGRCLCRGSWGCMRIGPHPFATTTDSSKRAVFGGNRQNVMIKKGLEASSCAESDRHPPQSFFVVFLAEVESWFRAIDVFWWERRLHGRRLNQ